MLWGNILEIFLAFIPRGYSSSKHPIFMFPALLNPFLLNILLHLFFLKSHGPCFREIHDNFRWRIGFKVRVAGVGWLWTQMRFIPASPAGYQDRQGKAADLLGSDPSPCHRLLLDRQPKGVHMGSLRGSDLSANLRAPLLACMTLGKSACLWATVSPSINWGWGCMIKNCCED